jgi:hypothetical protein
MPMLRCSTGRFCKVRAGDCFAFCELADAGSWSGWKWVSICRPIWYRRGSPRWARAASARRLRGHASPAPRASSDVGPQPLGMSPIVRLANC